MKPDRDEEPPDLYNFVRRTYKDTTNAYRAGMGLPPLKEPLSATKASSHPSEAPGESVMDRHEVVDGAYKEEDTTDWPDDHKLDDPRRGQASEINRRNK